MEEDIKDDDDLEDNNRQTYNETVGIKSRPSAFASVINPCAGCMLSRSIS